MNYQEMKDRHWKLFGVSVRRLWLLNLTQCVLIMTWMNDVCAAERLSALDELSPQSVGVCWAHYCVSKSKDT